MRGDIELPYLTPVFTHYNHNKGRYKRGTVTTLMPVQPSDRLDHEIRYAVLCMMGDHMDPTMLQLYWFNRVYHDCPECFGLAEWIDMILRDEYKDLGRILFRRTLMKDIRISTDMLSNASIDRLREEVSMMGQKIVELGPQIKRLTKILRQRDTVSFERLTSKRLMEPITAAQFMMIRGHTEHVVLTSRMLTWCKRVPRVLIHRDFPTVAPSDPLTYATFEYHARRQQRVYFPGLTSLEAHLLIHAGEGQWYCDKKQMACAEDRLGSPELCYRDGGGI